MQENDEARQQLGYDFSECYHQKRKILHAEQKTTLSYIQRGSNMQNSNIGTHVNGVVQKAL